MAESDGPFTDDMNEVIDRYIIVRDEQKAEIKRIQQAAAERAAAAKARREGEGGVGSA